MIDVVGIVASIEAEKKARGVHPTHALLLEINTEVKRLVKEELNAGVADGRLSWCETLNSYGFSTLNNNSNEGISKDSNGTQGEKGSV